MCEGGIGGAGSSGVDYLDVDHAESRQLGRAVVQKLLQIGPRVCVQQQEVPVAAQNLLMIVSRLRGNLERNKLVPALVQGLVITLSFSI